MRRRDVAAAIAPSAGWRDFWSYAVRPDDADDVDPVREMVERSSNGSRTLLLEQNLLHGGVYVLHGDRDDNVPVDQARFMRKRLAEFHPNWAYYERPGAGQRQAVKRGTLMRVLSVTKIVFLTQR